MNHNVVVRAQPARWHHAVNGDWKRSGETSLWEVVCADCGDDGGPFADQSAHVRRLRGPYPTEREAAAAARAHPVHCDLGEQWNVRS